MRYPLGIINLGIVTQISTGVNLRDSKSVDDHGGVERARTDAALVGSRSDNTRSF